MSRDVRGEDVFDSRDVIERIDELEGFVREDGVSELDEDETEELAELREFRDEVEDYCDDWRYGVTFIRDGYFERYAEEFASDIGAIDRDADWPLNRIDWEAAAEDLKQDYSSVSAFGEDYWYR